MRIAMIIEAWKPIWGGGQVVTYEVSQRLSKNHDVKIDLFVMNLDGYEGPEIEKINDNFRIFHTGKKRGWNFKDRLLWMLEVTKKIHELNKTKKYDLIHAHSNLPGFPGKLLSKIIHVPLVYQVHGTGTEVMQEMYGDNLKIKVINFLEVILHRHIKYDVEITVDNEFKNYKNVNVPIYIPNGVNTKLFDRYPNQQSGYFKILFVGRIHPQKGLKLLINAISGIKDIIQGNDIKIIIIGKGDQRGYLENQIDNLNLKDLFEFKGEKQGDDLIKEYKNSDLFILPSLYEGFPLTVLEAWASKVPVLTSDVGELPYLVKNDFNGWMFKKNDMGDLQNKILLAIQNKNKLPEFGLNGYKRVINEFEWDLIVSKYFDLYNRLRN